jgi:hypothetical protein
MLLLEFSPTANERQKRETKTNDKIRSDRSIVSNRPYCNLLQVVGENSNNNKMVSYRLLERTPTTTRELQQ